jgi:hypothetical protein
MKGNMYSFVKTWNPLAGECPHACSYCSTKAWKRFPVLNCKYSGELRLDEKAMQKNLGKDNTWFVCGQNDLFASNVTDEIIMAILEKCSLFKDNTYFFQSKNPGMFIDYFECFPISTILCTTIETNRYYEIMGNAPKPAVRALAMKQLYPDFPTQITIEPIMDFDLFDLVALIKDAHPNSVNIGADSKGHNLPEPSKEKVIALIEELKKFTVIDKKTNLERLLA